MRTPAFGIAWLLWRRNRWASCALLAYGAGLVLITRVWPAASVGVRMQVFAAALPLFFGLLSVMAAFAFPEADLAAASSGYPRSMLLLPVTTRQLVFWPMLSGAVTIALAWMALARLILIPNGMPVPVAWMAALLAATLAWLQVLCWSPMPLPYLRLMLGLLGLPLLAALGEVGSLNHAPSALLTGAYASLTALAYPTAVDGLARARRGNSPEWQWPWADLFRAAPLGLSRGASPLITDLVIGDSIRQDALGSGAPSRSAAKRTRPFASAAHAQLWLEWRRNGMVLPLLVACVGLFFTLPLLWLHDLAPMETGNLLPTPALQGLQLNVWVTMLKGAFFWPVVLAAVVGCGRPNPDSRRKDFALHPFLATRPLTSGALVAAKLQMAALSALAAWGVMLLFIGIWLLTPAREGDRAGTLAALLVRHCSGAAGRMLLFGLGALIGWTWKNQVQGLFVLHSGRRWVVYGWPAAVYGLFLAAFLAFVHAAGGENGVDLPPHTMRLLVTWLLGAALAIKGLTAGWAFLALHQQGLASARALIGWVGLWAALALGFYWLLSWTVREGGFWWVPLPPELLAAPYLTAAAALFVPLARLALATLALASNRHR